MRLVGWLSALFVVALVVGTGVVYVAHRSPAGNAGLAAAHQRQTAILVGADTSDPQLDPPHVVTPPSPSPTAQPPSANRKSVV